MHIKRRSDEDKASKKVADTLRKKVCGNFGNGKRKLRKNCTILNKNLKKISEN
jgi:hypothetical protein